MKKECIFHSLLSSALNNEPITTRSLVPVLFLFVLDFKLT